MTDLKNNTARIKEARKYFPKDGGFDDFKKAIGLAIPPQISVEAVKELRKKYEKLGWLYYEDEFSILHKINVQQDLDILLSQQ